MRLVSLFVLCWISTAAYSSNSYKEYLETITHLDILDENSLLMPIWADEYGSTSYESMRMFIEKNWQDNQSFNYNWNRLVRLWNSYANHFIKGN